MGNKFYLLKHHGLYENPKKEIDKLLDFVGLNIDPSLKENCIPYQKDHKRRNVIKITNSKF